MSLMVEIIHIIFSNVRKASARTRAPSYTGDMQDLPGGDLIEEGLRDLAEGLATIPALLVAIGAPRLRTLGFEVVDRWENPEHELYELLYETEGDAAHSRYN